MKIFITGATGFIGQHLVRRLLTGNHTIVALDVAPNQILLDEFGTRITFVQADLADGAAIHTLIGQYRPSHIAHLAFLLPPETETNPERAIQVNVQGLLHIVQAARLNDVKRVVWTSSMSVYGSSAQYPTQPVNEDAPTYPTGLYGATKVMAESLARHYFKQFGLDVIGLRANLVYGPGRVRGLGEFKIWSRDLFENAVYNQPVRVPYGDQLLDWLYVNDFARAIDLALQVQSPAHRLFNISGDWRPVRDAVRAVQASFSQAPIELESGTQPAERQPPAMDAQRAQTELGFVPEFDLERGVRNYLETISHALGAAVPQGPHDNAN